MERNYSFKEARQLISEYNELLRQLEGCKIKVMGYKSRIGNDSLYLLQNFYFQNTELTDLKHGKASESNYYEIEDLIRDIYYYLESDSILARSSRIYNLYAKRLNNNIKNLKKGKNIFGWIFSNRKTKEEAQSAYTYLNETLNASYYIEANDILNRLANLENVDKSLVYQDVLQRIERYRKIVFELYPDITKSGYNIEEIGKVIQRFIDITNARSKIEDDITNEKELVKKQLDKLISNEMINMLGDIPVEEIGRDKKGIRIKTLREYGCKTVLDIYRRSISQLESIPGISWEAATCIHGISREIANGAAKNVKIKLNADNKNETTTRIVTILSKYIRKNNYIKEYDRLLAKYKYEIETNLNKVYEVLNGIKYYFSTIEKKNEYIIAYKYLLDTIYGEDFGESINQAIKNYFSETGLVEEDAWQDFGANPIAYNNVIEELYPGLLGNDDLYYGLPEDLAKQIQEEDLSQNGLLCTLRHYQEMGVKYILHQRKVLLGDEMGLGKTIQAIAAMVSLKNSGETHFIVVCPASVMTNWYREVIKHSTLVPIIIHGSNKSKELKAWKQEGGVGITTYETTQHIKLEDDFKYSLLVVDEAHYIKNPGARRSRCTEQLSKNADRILFMTGTALENRVDEMINLIRILNQPIAKQVEKISYLSAAPKFREMVAPVYYRRKRDDVLTELPELIETKEWCKMGEEEEEVYEKSLFAGSLPEIRRLSWNVEDLKYSSKATRLKELIDEAKEDGRKIIVFTYFLNTIKKISEFLGDICIQPITGAVSSERRLQIIDEFDKSPAGTVLISQIMAGGTGLNIQTASVVIICEPQFKPSTENQAISRAYRMGQARNVLVYRLLCENSIDEKITKLLEEKQKIFDEFADKSVAAEADLINIDDKAFGEIVKAEKERVQEKHKND